MTFWFPTKWHFVKTHRAQGWGGSHQGTYVTSMKWLPEIEHWMPEIGWVKRHCEETHGKRVCMCSERERSIYRSRRSEETRGGCIAWRFIERFCARFNMWPDMKKSVTDKWHFGFLLSDIWWKHTGLRGGEALIKVRTYLQPKIGQAKPEIDWVERQDWSH